MAKPAPPSTIDGGHPLADGLVACFLFNEGTGDPQNLCTPSGSPVVHGSPSWTTGPDGDAMVFNGTDQFITTDNLYGGSTSGFSVVAWVRLDSEGNYPTFSSMSGTADLALRSIANLKWFDFVDYSSGGDVADDVPFSITLGTWYFVVAVQDGAADLVIYKDGIRATSPHVPTSAIGSLSAGHVIMAQSAAGAQACPGAISYLLWYDRALSSLEVASLFSDPYQFLLPSGPPPPPPDGPLSQPWLLTPADVGEPSGSVDSGTRLYPKALKWVGDDIADGDELQISGADGVVFHHFSTAADLGVEHDFPEGTVWHGMTIDSLPTGELYLYF